MDELCSMIYFCSESEDYLFKTTWSRYNVICRVSRKEIDWEFGIFENYLNWETMTCKQCFMIKIINVTCMYFKTFNVYLNNVKYKKICMKLFWIHNFIHCFILFVSMYYLNANTQIWELFKKYTNVFFIL